MFNLYKVTLSVFLLLLVYRGKSQTVTAQPKQVNWADKINLSAFHNLHKVDVDVYRSEQPKGKGMHQLDSIGIKTLVNLRHSKRDKAKETSLTLVHIPMNAWTISYTDIVAGLKAIAQAKKPVLVHCKYGSDRTGCIIAVYRITKCGWAKEEAIKELREGGFGFHEKNYPNILTLLGTLDIEKLKKDIQ